MNKIFFKSFKEKVNKKTMPNLVSGFTLIELLSVIGIIGILSSVVLVSLSDSKLKSKDNSAKVSMISIRGDAEAYFNYNSNTYGTAGSESGVCTDADVSNLLTAVASLTGNTPICVVGLDGGSYVVYVRLNKQTGNANFCIDSGGFSNELANTPTKIITTSKVSCQ